MPEGPPRWTAEAPGAAAQGAALVHSCTALVATVPRLVRPRPVDRPFLASLELMAPPTARQTVRLTVLPHGTSSAPTPIVVEGQRRPRTVEIGMTSYLVEHPQATFVLDPALCADVRTRVLRGMPSVKRAMLGGGADAPGLGELLEDRTIATSRIDFALATHLHWDHVTGLFDLPPLPLRVSADERVIASPWRRDAGVAGLDAAFALDRLYLDGPPVLSFARSHDLFGDGSVVLVDLPGHTPGSVGVLIATSDERVLFAGDAVWNAEQVARLRQRAPLPGRLVDDDRTEAFRTVHRLHAAAAQVRVVPAHDARATRQLARAQK